MADALETRASSNNEAKLSENSADSALPASGGESQPEDVEETYPPVREVILILGALALAIFLVSLVSSSSSSQSGAILN